MPKKVCIICGKERKGAQVQDDVVIRAIRRVKGALRVATNNTLVVCGGCMDEYKKKRAKFEKALVLYVVLAAILLVLIAVLPLISGKFFSLESILFGVLIGVFIIALSLIGYMPKIAEKKRAEKRKGKK